MTQFFCTKRVKVSQHSQSSNAGQVKHATGVLTDNVICKVVLPHDLQQTVAVLAPPGDEAVHFEQVLFRPILDAMLHNIAGDLLFREHEELVDAESDDLGAGLESTFANHSLNDVVAPVVCDQAGGDFLELCQQKLLVFFAAFLDHPLDHPASILLLRQLEDSATNGVVDEVDAVAWYLGEYLLDHVVSVVVLHDAQNFRLKLFSKLNLLLYEDVLKGLEQVLALRREQGKDVTYFLDTSATIQLHRKLHNVVLHLGSELLLLNHCAMLKKLLYHVVAKNIDHQCVGIDHDLIKDLLSVVTVRRRNLLL